MRYCANVFEKLYESLLKVPSDFSLDNDEYVCGKFEVGLSETFCETPHAFVGS